MISLERDDIWMSSEAVVYGMVRSAASFRIRLANVVFCVDSLSRSPEMADWISSVLAVLMSDRFLLIESS